ncbi:hypothetical protein ACSYDW_01385 [Paeniglutamicibacter sp. R2-26]|uniref:hypothetical protein n=1 Tax=Paeniglutamicibacter sp. R2-26 TaxID=3144417 RepID=UPI003EE71EA6
MSYNTVADMAYDSYLMRRITACAALEGITQPDSWGPARVWVLASQPGWADRYATAVQAKTPNPGADEEVITDAMIRTAVQSLRSAP